MPISLNTIHFVSFHQHFPQSNANPSLESSSPTPKITLIHFYQGQYYAYFSKQYPLRLIISFKPSFKIHLQLSKFPLFIFTEAKLIHIYLITILSSPPFTNFSSNPMPIHHSHLPPTLVPFMRRHDGSMSVVRASWRPNARPPRVDKSTKGTRDPGVKVAPDMRPPGQWGEGVSGEVMRKMLVRSS